MAIVNHIETRMTTFINMKLKKSDDQTNIDKYHFIINLPKNHQSKIHDGVVMRTYIVCRHHLEFSQFLVQAKGFYFSLLFTVIKLGYP